MSSNTAHVQHDENAEIDEWHARLPPEPILEPDLPIIDAHHHVWDIRNATTWPLTDFKHKVYLADEFSHDIESSGHNVTHTVFVECNAFYRPDGPEELRCVGETEFADSVAALGRPSPDGSAQLCAGIVSAADLSLGTAVAPVLDAHIEASPNFRGIRAAVFSDYNDAFMDALALLSERGLVFEDYAVLSERVPELVRLAQANPELPVVINHLGTAADPDATPEQMEQWRADVDAMAACPNTIMKLGGVQQRLGPWLPPFHMENRNAPTDSEELTELMFPFYGYVIEQFGPDRCMFESNFPVDGESVTYRSLWNTFKRIAAKLGVSDSEKTALFSGTASRVFTLDAGTRAER